MIVFKKKLPWENDIGVQISLTPSYSREGDYGSFRQNIGDIKYH